jgi:flagellin
MTISTNLNSQTAAANLNANQTMLSKSLARLSSGSKIVNPSDDSAGLAVSTRLDAQVSRIGAAQSNISDAVSFSQTQDGYLSKIGNALSRMSELSILAQDVTKTDSDRALYNQEFTTLGSYVTDAATKKFNGVPLFDGTNLDVTTDSEGATYTMAGIDLTASAYTTASGSTIDTAANAVTALTNLQAAITQLSQDRATVGVSQARLQYSADQLSVSKENLTAASSNIKDVDIAQESTQFAKENILVQSATAMLSQANQLPNSVLKLLQ